jgi:hypothetical protein
MRLLVRVEDRGRSHLVLADEGHGTEESWLSVSMTEEQALAVAALLTGVQLNVVEADVEPHPDKTTVAPDTVNESVLVNESSAIRGLPPSVLIQRLEDRAELLGVVCDATPQILEDDPHRPVEAGDRVVVAFRRAQREGALASLVDGGTEP